MLQPGTQVGRYEIQRRLGRGGMGAVYVAHDPILGRMVAIKVFSGDLDMPDARERFVREARAAAALNHANIVTIYDFGDLPSEPYIVMEYVHGETLGQVIRRKASVPLADKLRWMEELCAGVGYAHQHTVLHRDIKPANLMIDRAGRLRILDFGIARLMGTASTTTAVIGTPGYMAPEQLEGRAVDQRADLFSVGAVRYEVLAYTEAFPGDSGPAITHRVMTAEPPPLVRAVPNLPPEIAGIFEQALRKNPVDRPKDAETLRSAIATCRRMFESRIAQPDPANDYTQDGQTLVVPRPSGPAKRPGTGPADSAGTSPSEARRTDREALARRRAAQIGAALTTARARLAAEDLDGAMEACHQALTLDETHQEALALESEVQLAMDARAAAAAPAEPPAAAVPVSDLVQPAEVSESPDVANGQWDATLIVPARRTLPPAVAPTPEPELELELEPEPEPEPVEQTQPDATVVLPPSVRTELPAPGAAAPAPKPRQQAPPRQTRLLLMAAAAVAVVVAGAFGVMKMAGTPASGSLVIEAVPWAMVTAVENEDGERQALPPEASTPLLLNVPAGRYLVSVVGPPPASESRQITIDVRAGAVTSTPPEMFRALTPEEYFAPYLAGTAASSATPQ